MDTIEVLVDTVSGALETAPIALPSCRPRPPARLHHLPAPSGLAPSPSPRFGLAPSLAAFTAPAICYPSI
ncbi:hypothetical protein ACN42_g10846 [Penicillium freii]|uniref:Uncharacterized protein n=1 Tax=Penicillium freii TaxID=48697 RepID=A0A101M9L0_PENFR|nr:hypothetical protein ACN42_g10846 [Penicillium freii]